MLTYLACSPFQPQSGHPEPLCCEVRLRSWRSSHLVITFAWACVFGEGGGVWAGKCQKRKYKKRFSGRTLALNPFSCPSALPSRVLFVGGMMVKWWWKVVMESGGGKWWCWKWSECRKREVRVCWHVKIIMWSHPVSPTKYKTLLVTHLWRYILQILFGQWFINFRLLFDLIPARIIYFLLLKI